MMFTETNKMLCANVNIIDDNKKEGIESFMITLYTPERDAGQPGGAELRSPELEMFIHDDPSDGKHTVHDIIMLYSSYPCLQAQCLSAWHIPLFVIMEDQG